MCDDHRHVGEIGRDVVEVDRIGVLEFQPAAARHAGADAGMSGVEDGRQLVLGDEFVELIGDRIVREEALHRGVELEALDQAGLDEVAGFPHAHLALVRVDRGERDHHVGIGRGGFGHFLVGNALVADQELAVDREHDEADLALAVVGDGLGNGRTLARLEVLVGGLLVGQPVGVGGLPAGDFGVGVHVDGDELVELHGTFLLLPVPGASRADLLLKITNPEAAARSSAQCTGRSSPPQTTAAAPSASPDPP